MPIIAIGFDLPSREKVGKSIHSFLIDAKFAENFVLQNSPAEFFLFQFRRSLEVFAVSEDGEKLVSQLMEALQKKWNVPRDKLKKYHFRNDGSDAIARLFKLAIGLEESGDRGQAVKKFRDSFMSARERQWTGPYLNRLYQRGVWLSEKVRIELTLQENAVTPESVVAELSEKIFGNLEHHSALIAASSSICESFVEKLCESSLGQLFFVETGYGKIQRVLDKCRGRGVSFEQMSQVIQTTDLVLIFDKEFDLISREKEISRIMSQRKNAPLLWINFFDTEKDQVNKDFSKYYNIYYYDKADLENIVSSNLKEHQKATRLVDDLINKEVEDFINWVNTDDQFRFGEMIGKSKAMQKILELVAQIAQTDISVLIDGESGTGKELVARAIHEHSRRAANPFVVVNCGAMSETLLESELFGHVRGAFTGATSNKKGLFEAANHGTIFLDEIGETSLAMQVKLLRFLQDGEIKPVGSNASLNLDVRLITATNRNLEEMVAEETFRQDLFYRLNVIQITVPPLRDRREDVLPLTEFFMKKYGKKIHKSIEGLQGDAKTRLRHYHWPGNVRELENAIERAVALCSGSILTLADFPPNVLNSKSSVRGMAKEGTLSLKELERNHIAETLEKHNWDYDLVTKILGIGRTTLWRKMKAYDISSLPNQNI